MSSRIHGPCRLGRVLAAIGAICLLASANAAAALEPFQPPPPIERPVNGTGVDVANGTYSFSAQDVVMGQPGLGGLTYERTFLGNGWRDSITGTIDMQVGPFGIPSYTVSIGATSDSFGFFNGSFTPNRRTGATLEYNSGTGIYTYTTSDGTVAEFDEDYAATMPFAANKGRIVSLTRPDGEKLTFTYKTVTVCVGSPCQNKVFARVQAVANNLGYMLKIGYERNAQPAESELPAWFRISKVEGVDLATIYCDPTANSCAGIPPSWPQAYYARPNAVTETVMNSENEVTTYTYDTSNRIVGIRRPSSATDNIVVTYDTNGRVATVSDGAGTWTYAYVAGPAAGYLKTAVTDPTSVVRVTEATNGLLGSEKLGTLNPTTYLYDSYQRRKRVTQPEGNYTELTYDDRGNVTQVRDVAKPSSGLDDLVTTAGYEATCEEDRRKVCNQPLWTKDARANASSSEAKTEYEYSLDHGGVLSVTLPAPTDGAARPQTRYDYSSLHAWFKDASGTVVEQSPAVWRLAEVSTCATGADDDCDETADEIETTIAYGVSGVANHRLPTSVTSGSENGALAATTVTTYDQVGNVATVQGPLGTDDVTQYRYDRARRLVGLVGPDPDGAGPLLHRATRVTYNDDGQPTLTERGTVYAYTNPAWNAFVSLEQQGAAYNAQARLVKQTLEGGGSIHAVMQYSYDNAGRPDCSAVRMNSFTSPPSSACSASTGSVPDRIGRNDYDAFGRLEKVIAGYGTADQRDEATATWTQNGQQATLTDANGNKTTYEYDGFDRLKKTRYPSPTTPGTSSTTDYEFYVYDANSNVVTERRRSGGNINYTWDLLNRMTVGVNGATYAYDNLGRLTGSTTGTQTYTYVWDALSRQTSETGPLGTVAWQYDIAGRRTRLTWPDAFYVTYEYLLTGDMTAIKESGSFTLATIAYDNLGRRTTLARGNGAETTYGYDAISRLSSLEQDLSGTTNDVTFTFSRNNAGQMLTRNFTNAAYAPTMADADKSYTTNGLNQYTAVSGTSLTYDNRGNLTGDGTRTWGYDIVNRMTSTTGVTYSYDPLGRLVRQVANGVATWFGYDGADMIGEYNTGANLQRRYVHGPAFDEPLVWYEGSGINDRRWLMTDDMGSVIAITNSTGALVAINTYDEYGVPSSDNAGGFQYTGQAWMSEASLYYYKARVYNPNVGRFLQADAIGYADGANLYAYVGNDPVNAFDPSGMAPPRGFEDPLCDFSCEYVPFSELPEGFRPLMLQEDPTTVEQLDVTAAPKKGSGGGWDAAKADENRRIREQLERMFGDGNNGVIRIGDVRPEACKAAAYICLADSLGPPPGPARDQYRRMCMIAEATCQGAKMSTRNPKSGDVYVHYPDGTLVKVRKGEAAIVGRMGRFTPSGK